MLARCGADVHVSNATVTWLTTESVAWFQGWNGNSSLKVMQGTIQPSAQGGSFHIQEWYLHLVISGQPYNLASISI